MKGFIFNGITIALFMLMAYAALPIASSYNQVFLYIAIPGAALLSFISSKDKSLSKYMVLLSLLFIWIFITSFFSYDINVSFVWLRRVLAVYLLCIAIHQIAKVDNYIPWAYLVWMIMYIGCLIYAQNVMSIEQIDYTNDRVSDSNLNANTLGYYTFFATTILYFWGDLSQRFRRFFRIAFLLTIPLSFYIALITASRQILVIQVPLILFLLFARYIKGRRGIYGGFFTLLLIGFSFVVASYVIKTYESSFLFQRYQMDLGDDIRTRLIRDGIETGLDHFISGVGVGCFGLYNYGHDTFAHNTYIELFATTGLFGPLIYVYMMLRFIFVQFRRYCKLKKTDYLVFMFVGVIYALDNMVYVFHTDPWLMAFFILLTSHAEVAFKKDMSVYENQGERNIAV